MKNIVRIRKWSALCRSRHDLCKMCKFYGKWQDKFPAHSLFFFQIIENMGRKQPTYGA